MEEDTVVGLPRPGGTAADDPLLAVLREGARRMLTQAIEAEVAAFLAAHAGLVDGHGRRRSVGNGHAPERRIRTGIGPVEVRRPRVRDRGDRAEPPSRFTSAVLPAYRRRTRNVEELLPPGSLPQGHLHGPVRGGAHGPAGAGRARPVGGHDPPPGEHPAGGAPALATPRPLDRALRLRLGRRGVRRAAPRARPAMPPGPDRRRRRRPEGAPGARGRLPRERAVLARAAGPAARRERARHRPGARHRRRRARLLEGGAQGPADDQATTVLGAQDGQRLEQAAEVGAKAKADLHAIYEAPSRAEAEAAFDRCLAKYGAKYDKAAHCPAKDRAALLAFYDVPAEHWKHVRSTTPVESTFAPVRLRTATTKGRPSRDTALALVFKLVEAAERHWRRLNGPDRLAEVIRGVRFRDGEPVQAAEDRAAAA